MRDGVIDKYRSDSRILRAMKHLLITLNDIYTFRKQSNIKINCLSENPTKAVSTAQRRRAKKLVAESTTTRNPAFRAIYVFIKNRGTRLWAVACVRF